MTEKNQQYFASNPESAHDFRSFSYDFAGKKLFFKTDAGVFSKNRIDYGTQVLLRTVYENYDKIPAGPILDLGTGYGPVGVCLKAIDPKRAIEMVDVNQRSLGLAAQNLAENGLSAKLYLSDRYQKVNGNFAAVIVNPPIRAGKKIVTDMLTGAYDHLLKNGSIFAVLQKKQGAPSAEKNLLKKFDNCQIIKRDKGYYVLRSVRN